MKKFLNWKLYLLGIVLIAAFLRFNNLGTNPPSLTWDEVAWGYNAYSIGIDGKDEFGRFLPINYLESFGDFKPPMYAYLDVIPVKILGLNEFSTRFPSALFGVLTVLMTFFLVRRIFRKDLQSSIINQKSNAIALLSALFLAISPWHIMLSRAAFEANVATFFIVVGVWAFLAGVQDRKWYLIISAVSFALSMYTFNTSRIVSPILVLLLVLVFRKKLFSLKKETLVAFFTGLLIILPILGFLLSSQAALRFKEVNIFSNPETVIKSNQEIANNNGAWWSKIVHNRRVLYSLNYLQHYFDNLNPAFLFIKGDGNPKFSTQSVGQMYIWDIVFFIGGILFLFRKKEGYWWIIPLWLIIAIIPAATARETPHALRIETALPTFQILTAYGFVVFLDWAKKQNLKIKTYKLNLGKVLPLTFYVLLFFSLVYFYHDYFYQYKYEFSGDWQYGYKQSIGYVSSVQNKYDFVQVTKDLGRPYIYYLFYNKTNPDYFRNNAIIKRDGFGFVSVEKVGKYLFPVNYDYSNNIGSKILYINYYKYVPVNAKILKTFYSLSGEKVFVAYTYN